MDYPIHQEGKFKFIETKGGEENLMLLHGLFGALSNFEGILNYFGDKYNVIVPILPIYELPLLQVTLSGLMEHVIDFVELKGYHNLHVLGNSLGGHIALLYVLAQPERVKSIILTGSSGLFESALGSNFPKRGDYDYIRKKTEATFFDPSTASKELVDEVFDIVNDRNKAIRIIATAKSAVRHNLSDKLNQIKVPAMLIWGKQDNITPPFVGEKFNELLPDSRLVLVENCGHAPMMERPEEFNHHLETFLKEIK